MSSAIKRCSQFFRALFAKMQPADWNLVESYLDEKEVRLFASIDPAIQKHCVNVARTIQSYQIPEDQLTLLVRAALLHDIGKTRGTFRLADRVLYVLINKLSTRLTQAIASPQDHYFFHRLRKAFYIHLNHPQIGADMLTRNGIDKDIIFLTANHHNHPGANKPGLLEFLIKADEQN